MAREVSRSASAGDPTPAASLSHWLRRLVTLTIAVTAASLLCRDLFAAAIGVDLPWAAAATLPTGCLWLILSVQRGALQGMQRYRLVGGSIVVEAAARLAFGLLLVAAGLDVTGAFLGTALSVLGTAVVLQVVLTRSATHPSPAPVERVHRFRDLLGRAWAPVLGLALIAVLQNVDVIVVKHQASGDAAGSYAAAAVAAKVILWIAVGLGLYLLPEAARRTHVGLDARPVLIRTLALVAAASLPIVVVYGVASHALLAAVFGGDLTAASGALPWLALAMALLACAYLSVQYLLALGRTSFIWLLGVAAVAEPVLLQGIGAHLTSVALALFGIQAALAACVLGISFRAGGGRRAPARAAA